jgi:NADPH:quinone reductase-like Zn-dependent oxidoreductase
LPEDSIIVLKPSNLTYEEAVAIPYGGELALYFVRKGNIQSGQKVLIYGASGSIGTTAVQLAKHFGAKVTGICSTTNVEMVKSLGADEVIDYTREDFTKRGEFYNFILDAVPMMTANRKSIKSQRQKALAPNEKYISIDSGTPRPSIEDLIFLKELAESGTLKPVIDRVYPLEQIAEAHRYVETGRKKGNVIIRVEHNDRT